MAPLKIKENKILVIGLTGTIGSGKTEAATIFEQLGAKVYVADTMAKSLMVTHTTIRKKIISTFGKESYVADGSLNRAYLAREVFSNPQKLARLNAIVHPIVIDEIQKTIEWEKQSLQHAIVIVEAALIFEADIQTMFDYIILIRASAEKCIERIQQRDKISLDESMKRIESQMESKKKESKSDFVIDNSGSIPELREKVRFIHRLLLAMVKG